MALAAPAACLGRAFEIPIRPTIIGSTTDSANSAATAATAASTALPPAAGREHLGDSGRGRAERMVGDHDDARAERRGLLQVEGGGCFAVEAAG
jgi:Spy/CpxP family protein refolding chaperone